MKSLVSVVFICLFITSCGTYEKIGSFKYKIKIEKAWTGDYGGVVETIKTYNYKKKSEAGVIISSQIGFDSPADTIYTYGYSKIDSVNKRLIMKEYYFYGYSKALKTDSIMRVFLQLKNGKFELINYTRYYNGKANVK